MRALAFDGTQLNIIDAPLPKANRDQALLKIRRAGICNTDLELINGYRDFRGILGHEFVGEVIEGPAHLLGHRVVGEINVPDGTCDFCQRGIPSQCRNRKAVGIAEHDGAFAEYLSLYSPNLHAVPDEISDDAAVFVEPLAAALQILEAIHISPRDRVLVLGAGKLGMLVAQVLKLTGAEVIGVARHEKQAHLLAKWQITSASRDELPLNRAQVVVDCTGQESGFADALDLVEPRGTIVLKSTYHGIPTADLTRIAVNEIRVVGSRCGPFDAALRLLAMRLIDVESLIDARYSLSDGVRAVEHAHHKGTLKVLLDI